MAWVSWCARRQTCAAASTAEAEVVALGEAFRKMLSPMSFLISQVQRRDELCALGSDSTTALIAVDKGVTPAMKYLRKNQRISIASLSDGISSSNTCDEGGQRYQHRRPLHKSVACPSFRVPRGAHGDA